MTRIIVIAAILSLFAYTAIQSATPPATRAITAHAAQLAAI